MRKKFKDFKILLDPTALKWIDRIAVEHDVTSQSIIRGQLMKLIDSGDVKAALECARADKAAQKARKMLHVQKKELASWSTDQTDPDRCIGWMDVAGHRADGLRFLF